MMPPLKLRNGVLTLPDGRSRSENFCYQNTLMNIWRNLPQVYSFFSEREYLEENQDESSFPISTEIHKILTEKVNSCEGLRSQLSNIEGFQYLREGNQEDVNEFYLTLLNVLGKEYELCISGQELLKKFEIIHVQKKSFVSPCIQCNYQPEDRIDPQNNISIFVTRIRSGTGLQRLIDDFYTQEDERELACECQPPTNRALNVKTVVQKGPEYLFIELRRYEQYGQANKSEKIVKIPETLTLPNGDKYKLNSVANHHSDVMNSGHYSALVMEGDICYMANDENTSTVPKTNISSKYNYTVIYSKIQSVQPNLLTGNQIVPPLPAQQFEKIPCKNCKKSYMQLYPHIKAKIECQKDYDLEEEKRKHSAHLRAQEKNRKTENPVDFDEKKRLSVRNSYKKKNEQKQMEQQDEPLSQKVPCKNCNKSFKHLYPHIKGRKECQKDYDLADENRKHKARLLIMTKNRTERKKSENPKEFLEHAARLKKDCTDRKKRENPKEFLKHKAKLSKESRERTLKTSEGRIETFKKAVMYGAVFVCVSCEKTMFQSQVVSLDSLLDEKKGHQEFITQTIGDCDRIPKFKDKHWVCHNCSDWLKKEKLPPLCVQNNLKTFEITEEFKDLELTDLENCLLARNLLFLKIHKLPRSRMGAVTDR